MQLNDTVAPAVTLNSPVAHTAFSSNTINFNFTGTDNVDTTLNCTIFIDGVMNNSNASTMNGKCNKYYGYKHSTGNHTWWTQCNDSSNNYANATANFTVDTTVPAITLNTPAANNITNA